MSELYLYTKMTELLDKKFDALISTNEKLINLCEKNAEEITYLHKKIDELSDNKSVKESKLICNNSITEEELLLNINNGIFDSDLEGKEVILKEDDTHHIWIIVRVNSNSYDLWYNGSIEIAHWKDSGTGRYWTNNSSTDTDYVRGLCNAYKSRLSSFIQDKLKPGLNVNCSNDTVVILSAKQLGYTDTYVENDDNVFIPYFNSDSRRATGHYYWTSSASSNGSNGLWFVLDNGYFDYSYYDCNYAIVPAIRVGV